MKFVRETGAILSPHRDILSIIEGEPAIVNFPQEFMWEIHKRTPGLVFALSHVHPPNMPGLSSEDTSTLKAWCVAFYPYPLRMVTITATDSGFLETEYIGILEPREIWEHHKDQRREFRVIQEYQSTIINGMGDFDRWYGWKLIERSYE